MRLHHSVAGHGKPDQSYESADHVGKFACPVQANLGQVGRQSGQGQDRDQRSAPYVCPMSHISIMPKMTGKWLLKVSLRS